MDENVDDDRFLYEIDKVSTFVSSQNHKHTLFYGSEFDAYKNHLHKKRPQKANF